MKNVNTILKQHLKVTSALYKIQRAKLTKTPFQKRTAMKMKTSPNKLEEGSQTVHKRQIDVRRYWGFAGGNIPLRIGIQLVSVFPFG